MTVIKLVCLVARLPVMVSVGGQRGDGGCVMRGMACVLVVSMALTGQLLAAYIVPAWMGVAAWPLSPQYPTAHVVACIVAAASN